ncbi:MULTISPECIES: sigma-70 family RNA polymerase sigma factor [unclassified Leeuwenhoekiella]|uniref:RNA polymerase sigma factor n=1 Tax=unclassified Leeuwenhoekiella TaxID=2615029 RepID=UPI000C5080E5|nr:MULTISPECIES: sigma-70 family RNA polymerase sigma factor [unclassified Leeuwenhoekiella]MAW96056.1 RNA polymerase subunit sigma-70 [Leeuwenhoekiella sp.]MBA80050.1 RNA polymerase subunit sigma-70 [Leeuwenhoekiella sp.]
MSLDELIKKCIKKDIKAQEQLYTRYAKTLFSVSLKYARNYTEAEDILQDGFIIIFDKISQYKHKGSFEGWLKRIVINTALQRYRKQRVFNIVNEEHIEQEDVLVDEEDVSLQFLLKIVQELPDRYRLVFNLYALDGYSHKEIASMLEISEGTSKSNLARARMILKQKVEHFQTESKTS